MTADLFELLRLHEEYVPDEQRLQPPKDVDDLGVENRLRATAQTVPVGGVPADWQGLTEWTIARWHDALDSWMLFGEPIMACEHYDDIVTGQEVSHWFARWPSAMLCDTCGSMAARALDADVGSCDYCSEPSPRYTRLLAPGASVAAHVVLCHVCSPAEVRVA